VLGKGKGGLYDDGMAAEEEGNIFSVTSWSDVPVVLFFFFLSFLLLLTCVCIVWDTFPPYLLSFLKPVFVLSSQRKHRKV
jgi:hypothetical protein